MNPLTATLNIRFVVALYRVHKIDASDESEGRMIVIDRCTSGESSLSTCRACCAINARRWVGRGRLMTLEVFIRLMNNI